MNKYSSGKNLAYRPDIDGLRGLSILAVVSFHGFPNLIPGGYIGVSVFFVISGYLISAIIFNAIRENTFNFLDFYARRARRILPSLVLALIASAVIGWFYLIPNDYKNLGLYITGGALFVDNFIAWSQVGYFDSSAEYKPLLHLWSLAIEEQFYLFWPIIVWGAWKIRLDFLLLIGGIALLSFILNIYAIDQNQSAAFFSPWCRIWEILLGGLLAQLKMNTSLGQAYQNLGRIRLGSPILNFISTCSILILGGSLLIIDKYTKYPGWVAILPVLCSVSLIATGKETFVNQKILSNPFIIFFGKISYPLYLWHWILLSFPRIVAQGEVDILVRIFMIFIAVLISWLSYRLIEIPIRYGAHTKIMR